MKKTVTVANWFVPALFGVMSLAAAALAQSDAGPENAGLRLRFAVSAHSDTGKEGYDVRLDLLNVTTRAVTLPAAWAHEMDKGDVKDYIEAATSIETYPAIAPWEGQVVIGHRKSRQPECQLKPGEVLSVSWHTDGRRLKNKVTDPLGVRNPEFPAPGVYAVHATVKLNLSERTVLLRSNEQLVEVGGSRELPKHSYGQLWGVNVDTKQATLGLGSLHKIEPGDQFRIRTGMGDFWKLTIDQVTPEDSTGHLEPLLRVGPNAMNPNPRFPERLAYATLIVDK